MASTSNGTRSSRPTSNKREGVPTTDLPKRTRFQEKEHEIAEASNKSLTLPGKRKQSDESLYRLKQHNKPINVYGSCSKDNLMSIDYRNIEPESFGPATSGGQPVIYTLKYMTDTLIVPVTDGEFKKKLHERIDRILENLCYSTAAKKWSCLNNDIDLTALEIQMRDAFLSGMASGSGRNLCNQIVEIMSVNEQNYYCRNIGGCSSKDPCVRELRFFIEIQLEEPSVESVPRRNDPRSPETKMQVQVAAGGLPKQSSSDNGSSVSSCSLQGSSGEPDLVKLFVPDLVVLKVLSGGKTEEVLVISVKYGLKINDLSVKQLSCELLPMLLRSTSTLGLIISAGEAILMKLVREQNNDVCGYRKYYDFRGPLFKDKFVEMWHDVQVCLNSD